MQPCWRAAASSTHRTAEISWAAPGRRPRLGPGASSRSVLQQMRGRGRSEAVAQYGFLAFHRLGDQELQLSVIVIPA